MIGCIRALMRWLAGGWKCKKLGRLVMDFDFSDWGSHPLPIIYQCEG